MAVILNAPPLCFKAKRIRVLIRPDVSQVWPYISHARDGPKPLEHETLDETALT